MRDNFHCNCHICKVERHLFTSLSEPPGSVQFSTLTLTSPPLAKFTSVSDLLGDLHAKRNADSTGPLAGELLAALLNSGATIPDFELIHSVLVLAFTPTIHRTYREVRAWFRELEPDDIAQQILTFFLELTASMPVETLNALLPIMLARSLRKNAFRWAEKESRVLLQREREREGQSKSKEPAAEDNFESVSILNDFLDYCCHIGALSTFERDMLIKIRIEGFLIKEVPSTNPVLSARAVESRIQRILKRLQRIALQGSVEQPSQPKIIQPEESKGRKNPSPQPRIFSLRSFSDFLPISKSRRQLSLDSSPKQSESKQQQFAAPQRILSPTITTLSSASRRTRVIPGAAPQRRAAIQSSGFPPTLARHTKSGERLSSNPDAGLPRIIRKELAGNEEILPKQICLSLAPARVHRIFLVSRSLDGCLRSSGRRLAVGERRQRFDAGVHDHYRAWSVTRLHCGRRSDFRFW
jgi:hypothetical protein